MTKVPIDHQAKVKADYWAIFDPPGGRSCFGMVWAVFDRASRGWRYLTMTPAPARQPQEPLRRRLHPDTPKRADTSVEETMTSAALHHHQEPASVANFPPELGRHIDS